MTPVTGARAGAIAPAVAAGAGAITLAAGAGAGVIASAALGVGVFVPLANSSGSLLLAKTGGAGPCNAEPRRAFLQQGAIFYGKSEAI